MRFLFLTLGYHPDMDGGAYRYAAEVAEGLATRGHEVHAIFPNPANSLAPQETRKGVQLHRIESAPGSFTKNWTHRNAAARSVLTGLDKQPHGPQLIASHHAYFEPAQAGLAQIQFFHGPWGLEYSLAQKAKPRGFLRRLLDPVIATKLHRTESKALRRCRKILVASEYMKSQLAHWHPSVTVPIQVVGGGVNLQQFHPAQDRALTRTCWNLAVDTFLFLTVRRLDPRMGLLPLIESFAAIAANAPNALLWLAGRGPQEAELQSMIEAKGLVNRVRLLGFVPEADLTFLYQAADCTLMPSLDLEGFGLATAESLACGTPVVASDSGANPEVVRPLGAQCIFPTGNTAALAALMRDIVAGSIRLPSREVCVQHAQRHFRWDRPVEAFEASSAEVNAGGSQ